MHSRTYATGFFVIFALLAGQAQAQELDTADGSAPIVENTAGPEPAGDSPKNPNEDGTASPDDDYLSIQPGLPEAGQGIEPKSAQNTDGANSTANNNQPASHEETAFHKSSRDNRDKTKCDETFTYANALMRAENAYVRRRYTSVIEILKPLYEKIQCIDDSVTVIEIDLLLGVAYYEENNKSLADTFFMNVLRSDPDHTVGSIITLPESSVRRIEELRAEHEEELNKLRALSSPNTVIESLYVLVEKEQHPYWINFMPFGAGQFQMHEIAWGVIYAATQIAGIGLSILGGAMVEYYRGDNFTYTPQNRARAQNWQNAQIVGISLLGVSYLAGVIHALCIYEKSTLIIHSPSQTRPDLAHASPFMLPDGGGILYSMEF